MSSHVPSIDWKGIDRDRLGRALVASAAIPILAVFTSLVLGMVIIWASGADPLLAYGGLWDGAFGTPKYFSETLVATIPYILAGLAVAVGFKCGLFNIGAEGQLYMGALCSVWVGYSLHGLPPYVHLPLALLAGCVGGAVWGAIPGYLKARTGAHEVINTIMMNYIAAKLVDYLVKNPMKDPAGSVPRTPFIEVSAQLPQILPPHRLHWGLAIAVIAAFLVYWLLWKTTIGFEIRTVGANPSAARYAGISIGRNFVIAMALSGTLAGLGGAGEVLGLNYNLPAAFSTGYGFDSIAVALLAKSHPIGILPAAFLFGALRNGASLMQLRSGIPIDLIGIVQALVIIFIAADQIIRWVYRIRVKGERVQLPGIGRPLSDKEAIEGGR